MKRFHVHVAVKDIDESVRFYSKVFGAEPTVLKPDYAKWIIEDPRLNFAISTRGSQPGINHLGLQVDTEEELQGMRDQLAAADAGLVAQVGASCCYAKSDKYWVTDPQGIPWETYHSLGAIPMFGGAVAETAAGEQAPSSDEATPVASSCCTPAVNKIMLPIKTASGCCAKA